MTRCVEVQNGEVVNVVEATPEVAVTRGLIPNNIAQIGWVFDGKAFKNTHDSNVYQPTLKDIQQEANRRIDVGVITNGKPYKTDDATTQKLAELVQGFKDGDVPKEGYIFTTAAGEAISYKTEIYADTIRRFANAYRAQVMQVVGILGQGEIPLNYQDDVHWPKYEDII